MATLKGFDRVEKRIVDTVDTAMRTKVKDHVIKHAELNLSFQRDKTGQMMPKKFQTKTGDKVRAAYIRKGWDTEKFLVASGKSTQMLYEWLNHELTVYPLGQTILEHHIPKRTDWVQPTAALIEEVENILSKELARVLS